MRASSPMHLPHSGISMQVTSEPTEIWTEWKLAHSAPLAFRLYYLAYLVNLMLCNLFFIASFVSLSLPSTPDIFRGLDGLLHSDVHFYKRIRTLVKEDEQQTLRFIGAKKEDATLCSKIITRMDWGLENRKSRSAVHIAFSGKTSTKLLTENASLLIISLFPSRERLGSSRIDLLRYHFSIQNT